MKIACVAVVKDEERYIAEWIAYQLALGFDAVIILDNNSGDQTRAIAAQFTPRHDVRVFELPMRMLDYQLRAFEFAARQFAGEFDWLTYLSTNEFLVLDSGLSLKDILAARGGAAAVAVSWAVFGSSGHRESPGGLVIEAYQHRSASIFRANRHVKSIIRPKLMGPVLHTDVFEMDGGYTDLTGRAVDWESPGFLAAAPDYAGGKLHLYAARSWMDWQAKLRRGYRNWVLPDNDFDSHKANEIFDDTGAQLAPLVKSIISDIAKRD